MNEREFADRDPIIKYLLSLHLAVLSVLLPAWSAAGNIIIQSRINGGEWSHARAIYPQKGDPVELRVKEIPGATIHWYRIIPDISKLYKNANFPWERDAYQWVGFAKIDYCREELTQLAGKWQVDPLAKYGFWRRSILRNAKCSGWFRGTDHYRTDIGSFWFQVEVVKGGRIEKSPGIEQSGHKGLSPDVFRMSIREGDGYLGYVTSFFNVPGLFGAVTYQGNNYIGVDCAEVVSAAYAKWSGKSLQSEASVATVVATFDKIQKFKLQNGRPDIELKWGTDIHPGDLLAVGPAENRYIHVGALYKDKNGNGVLDGADIVLHAGPDPLHASRLKGSCFRGAAIILRPPQIE